MVEFLPKVDILLGEGVAVSALPKADLGMEEVWTSWIDAEVHVGRTDVDQEANQGVHKLVDGTATREEDHNFHPLLPYYYPCLEEGLFLGLQEG